MNTMYPPVRKIVKVVTTNKGAKREYEYTSLLETIEDKLNEKMRGRSKWTQWVVLMLLTTAVFYAINHWTRYFPLSDIPDKYVPSNIEPSHNMDILVKFGKPHKHSRYVDNDTQEVEADLLRERGRLPVCVRSKNISKVTINKTRISLRLNNVYPALKHGGYFRPKDCLSQHKVGILVPYRGRPYNLGIFLLNIHPFLMQQKLEYQIFVIEQYGTEPFNKGRLFNAGFLQMMKFNTFKCVIFHDLDLLPSNTGILYTCPTLPRHMCAAVDDYETRNKYHIKYDYKSIFGGVIAMSVSQFERANGYSNMYFGWGAEDNDLFWRLRASGYPVTRVNKTVGIYTVLPHLREPVNQFRNHLLGHAIDRYRSDGLNSIEYSVHYTKFNHLFTHLIVDINPNQRNISHLYNF